MNIVRGPLTKCIAGLLISTLLHAQQVIVLKHLSDAGKVAAAIDKLAATLPTATVAQLDADVLAIVPRKSATPVDEAEARRIRDLITHWDMIQRDDDSQRGVVRLFHLRNASAVATAVNSGQASGEPKLQPIGDDLLVITGGGNSDRSAGRRIRRLVSLIDQPQPQITLQLWTVQISDKNPKNIETKFEDARGLIEVYDVALQDFYVGVWNQLRARIRFSEATSGGESSFYDSSYGYATGKRGCEAGAAPAARDFDLCYDLDLNGAPSLSQVLVVLALSRDPLGNAHTMLRELAAKNTARAPSGEVPGCALPAGTGPVSAPCLRHTSAELDQLFDPNGLLHSFRAAIVDYLFHYRASFVYPNDFSPYSLSGSADTLNSFFGPVVEAFNKDIEEFVESMRGDSHWPKSTNPESTGNFFAKLFLNKEPGLEGLAESNNVKIVTLSANQAQVISNTSSSFDITPPPNFFDVTGAKSDDAGGVLDIPPLTTARLLTALSKLANPSAVTAEVSRGVSLKVTPYSLATSSAAELNLELTVGDPENAPPKIVGSTKDTDILDRIAKLTVDTKVRVPGARLFEVSTFAQDVAHPRPDGVFPIVGQVWNGFFGGVPVLDGFFKWKREPANVYHRSLVVVSALIAPTSADLARGIRFAWTNVSPGEGDFKKIFDAHKKKIQRISAGQPLSP